MEIENNYYEIFAGRINRSQSAKDILDTLETLCKTAKIEHNKRIEILSTEAKGVFESEESKSEYDKALDAANRPDDSADVQALKEAEKREKEYSECMERAKKLYKIKQFSSANHAITDAEGLLNSLNKQDPDFYITAAKIFVGLNNFAKALEYMDKAKSKFDGSDYYIYSGRIYRSKYNYSINQNDSQTNIEELVKSERSQWELAVDFAKKEENTTNLSIAYGLLANSYWVLEPKNETQAEKYAKEAIKYGDNIGCGQKVLKAINEKREKERKAYEAQKKQEEAQRAREVEEQARRNRWFAQEQKLKAEWDAQVAVARNNFSFHQNEYNKVQTQLNNWRSKATVLTAVSYSALGIFAFIYLMMIVMNLSIKSLFAITNYTSSLEQTEQTGINSIYFYGFILLFFPLMFLRRFSAAFSDRKKHIGNKGLLILSIAICIAFSFLTNLIWNNFIFIGLILSAVTMILAHIFGYMSSKKRNEKMSELERIVKPLKQAYDKDAYYLNTKCPYPRPYNSRYK